ncbi:RDD family protein [Glaciecola sp. XM2]|uniref:RDD family protein n=1 Tax=Glaciecola sp. XM2 TaxID=1914931 RepID=UPI001BDE8F07|nr:RDD family protein [Glaciecola sp. XM2]MBT1451386.1 RDD family protein [Glaciecola sp. XM2]
MDLKIDFSRYTLDELYDSSRNIDRDMYPERAREIDALIAQRQNELPLGSSDEIENEKVVGEKASRWDRLFASLIDALIHIIATIPLILYFGSAAFVEPTFAFILTAFVYGLCVTLMLQGYLLYTCAQTIGKHIIGTRIENLDGTKADFKRIIFVRILPMSLCALIPVVGQFIVGFINPLFIFGKQRRCLHDYIAKTKVSYT